MRRLLEAQIKAYEIQGVLALENAFNRVGLDHVILVKVATAATATWLMGGDRQRIADVLSNAWIDLGPLRTYRHAPNTGVSQVLGGGGRHLARRAPGPHGHGGRAGLSHGALRAPRGDSRTRRSAGSPSCVGRPFGSYVAENILFKVSFPAEFHAQTAVEAALILHGQVKDRLERIRRIRIRTQESALRIIDKRGPLHNPADRDHCLQYAAAVALIHGDLRAEHYEEETARDPRIDRLRERMEVEENPRYTADYLDPGQALHRQLPAGLLRRRNADGGDRGGVPHRPSPPPRRKPSPPLCKAPFESRAPLSRRTAPGPLSSCSRTVSAWSA